MAKIKITCDPAVDLPRELAQRYRISILPEISLPETESNQEKAPSRFSSSAQTGQLAVIAPLTSAQYRQSFLAWVSQGYEVIHIALSGAIAPCFGCARQAAGDLPNIHIVDSRSFSVGAGQLALLAAELAGADYRAPEIVSALESLREHLEISFVIQQPQYLKKSLQGAGLSAIAEKLLHLKPQLVLRGGLPRWGRPFRGDMESTILSYVRSCLEGRKNIQTDRVFLTYSQVPGSILEKVRSLLLRLQPFEEILETPASSPLTRRCGPGCLGLSYLTSRELP